MIRDILSEFSKDHRAFDKVPDAEGAFDSSLTVYVPNDVWLPARDVAYIAGRRPVSVFIRKGIISRLSEEKNMPA